MTARTTAPEATERRFRALAVNAFDLVSEIDAAGQVVYESPNHTVVLGSTLSELLSGAGGMLDMIHPDDRETVVPQFRSVLVDGTGLRVTFRLAGDDEPRWMECTASPFEAEDGTRHVVLVSRDVTEARRTEAHLRASRERFRLITENAFDMIAEYDAAGRVLYANERTREVLGYAAEDTRAHPPEWIVHPEDVERVVAESERLKAGATTSIVVTYRIRRADQSWAWIEANVHAVRRSDGKRRLLVIARDVSARIAAEGRLRESEERYRALVEGAPVGIIVVQNERVVFANPVAAELCGARDATGLVDTSMFDLIGAADAQNIARRLERNQERWGNIEVEVRGLDGRARLVLATGSRITYRGEPAVQGILRDITEWREAEREQERLELQLQESRKLESLGVLAGGIAHDFNNLLAVILGNVRYANGELGEDHEIRDALTDAVEAAESAARLTRQLLAYAGRREPEVRAVDLTELVQSTRELLGTALSRQIDLELNLDDRLPAVWADAVQLEQVLMNLVINAADALGEEAGTVTVSTGRSHVSFEQIRGWIGGEGLAPGEYAHLEVRDDGRGMDAVTRDRIFDPFFTTKSDGHGLGLSAVLGLVRGHGGAIALETALEAGTRMRVHLPLGPNAATASSGSEPALEVAALPAATVLVLDPDPAMRRLAKRALEGCGVRALEAPSAERLLDLVDLYGDEVDLALIDVAAGTSDAREVAAALRRLRGDLPLLLTSSRDEPELVRALAREAPAGLLRKPYREADLVAGLRDLLGKS